jgi:hypothetical protein
LYFRVIIVLIAGEANMNYLVLSFLIILATSHVQASVQDETTHSLRFSQLDKTVLMNDARQGVQQGELFIHGKNEGKKKEDFYYKIGEQIHIYATGEIANRLKMTLAKIGISRTPTLLFDGIKMVNLPSAISQLNDGHTLRVSFFLERNPQNKESREAWNALFKAKHDYLMPIEVSLRVGDELPLILQSAYPFHFYVAPTTEILFMIGGALLILLVVYYLIVNKTNMLKDKNTGHYSLGKSQMTFWGLLVMLAFISVWILTGTMEHIPEQSLILLGISGATGLSAILIGNTKKSNVKAEITKLFHETQKLSEQKNISANYSPETENQLTTHLKNIEALMLQLNKQNQPMQSNGFWRDICDDGDGLSFHRLQVVVWTIILGMIFARSVADSMSIPEFPETLLVLMGISNLTYLGFKIPEKL